MKLLRLIICLLASSYLSYGQELNPIDSLKFLPESTDAEKIRLLNKAAVFSFQQSPSDVVKFASEARKMAQTNNLQPAFAESSYNLGVGYFFEGKYPEALSALVEAHQVYQKEQLKDPMAKTLNLIGGIHLRQGHHELALKSFKEALIVFEQRQNQKLGSLN